MGSATDDEKIVGLEQAVSYFRNYFEGILLPEQISAVANGADAIPEEIEILCSEDPRISDYNLFRQVGCFLNQLCNAISDKLWSDAHKETGLVSVEYNPST